MTVAVDVAPLAWAVTVAVMVPPSPSAVGDAAEVGEDADGEPAVADEETGAAAAGAAVTRCLATAAMVDDTFESARIVDRLTSGSVLETAGAAELVAVVTGRLIAVAVRLDCVIDVVDRTSAEDVGVCETTAAAAGAGRAFIWFFLIAGSTTSTTTTIATTIMIVRKMKKQYHLQKWVRSARQFRI